MQTFSDFLNEYRIWKMKEDGVSEISSEEVRYALEAYSSNKSKKYKCLKDSIKESPEMIKK